MARAPTFRGIRASCTQAQAPNLRGGIVRLDFPVSVVRAAQSGDTAAVSVLLRGAWPAAFRIARSILMDNAAAEDAAQAGCARAFEALDALRRPDHFAPWFYRIVVNEAKSRLRTRSRELPLDRIVERPGEWRDEIGARDDRMDVRAAIDALEPGLRATIVLRYYFGMRSAEIGRVLSISPVTARWRLMTAHRKLRVLLEPPARAGLAIRKEPCR